MRKFMLTVMAFFVSMGLALAGEVTIVKVDGKQLTVKEGDADKTYTITADPKANATITATSSALAHPDPDPSRAERTTQLVFDPDAPSKRSVGELYATTPGDGPALPRSNTLTIKATNLAEVTVDLDRAHLRSRGLRIRAESDKPFTLILRSGRAQRRVSAG